MVGWLVSDERLVTFEHGFIRALRGITNGRKRMLFERVPGLYGSSQLRFEEFKHVSAA